MAIPFYLILGAAHSGRKILLADIVEHGFQPDEQVIVYTASTEKLEAADAILCSRTGTEQFEWRYDESGCIITDPIADMPAAIFFIADGYGDPADLLEALPCWLQQHNLIMTRVITVIDAKLLSTHEAELSIWFNACLHFSDYALLTHTAEVAPKWLRSFMGRYQKDLCYPCLFEVTKNNTVANPALVLDPEIRRISVLFDTSDEVIEEEDTEEPLGEPTAKSTNLDIALFERLSDGRRKLALLDIKKFIR